MTKILVQHDASDLVAERELLRRSLQRSTVAAVIVLLVAVGLAVAAAVSASKARRSQTDATESLWSALSAEAGGGNAKTSGFGSKQRTLEAIDAAVAIRPSPELRDRAISALARTDLLPQFKVDGLLGGVTDQVKWATFSPDFDTVFVSAADGSVVQFSIPEYKKIRTFEQEKKPHFGGKGSYTWLSPDGRFLAMRYYWGAIVVWDVQSGEQLLATDEAFEASRINTLAFHPLRPNLLLVAREKQEEIRIFDLDARKTFATISLDSPPQGIVFDSASQRFAVEVGSQLQVFAWNNSTPTKLAAFDLPTTIGEVDWHPDGDRIAAAGYDGTIYVFETHEGKIIRRLKGHGHVVHYLNYSPSGDILLSDSWDNTTRLWDSESGQQLLKSDGVYSRHFSQDGECVAGNSITGVHGFEIDRSDVYHPLAVMNGREGALFNGITFSPDGRLVAGAAGADYVVVWDRESGKVRSLREGLGSVMGIAFTSDSQWLIASSSKQVSRWEVDPDGERDVLSGTAETLENQDVDPGEGKISSDGRWFSFLTSKGARYIPLSEPADGLLSPKKQTRMTGVGNANAVVSPDERFIACTDWGLLKIEIYDFHSGELIAELDSLGGGAQFSPDSQELVTVSKEEVVFWSTKDWSRGATYYRPREAASYCVGINWSRDGRLVAVAGVNGKIQLLDGEHRGHRLLATLTVPYADRLHCVEFSPDGKSLAAGANNSRCHFWDLEALEKELESRQLHWGQDGRAATNPVNAGIGGALLLAAVGALAAIGFGLFTLLYQRSLIRRFTTVETIAERNAAELVDAELRIAQSEKLKALGTLSAGVAHDFKNLLSVVRLSNDLIRRDASDREDILEEVDAIGNAVAQGDQVVNAMLGYSRDADSDPAEKIDVSDVIEGTVSLLGQQFLSGVRLQLDLERDMPEVAISPGALEQILLNLVVNASEAMDGRGVLAITASVSPIAKHENPILSPRPAANYTSVRIADSGPGMEATTLERIFEPFFTTKTVGAEKGTGLGLATVFKIANDNGIGLGVGSVLGEGTEFSLLLPTA